ncbi:type VII secretion-associated serine protease mycosin [Acrocarpospora macrocephala]|uniref:Type VII secretion-associated serine protease n=2 Tax=Acrocarpospora macrocephala TaxID=150177 RepID=A0A5M3XAP6_9ACTN|nr:type VII secretion-associated serine protease [Acrocarpospora macrocephala]
MLLLGVLPTCLAACLVTGAAAVPGPKDGLAESARGRQWPLRAMDVQEAWQRSRGAGVTVAVLDTGVDPRHPDLAGVVVRGPDLTGADRTRFGRHGTAMASLIAGRGHGAGRTLGVLGVAPEARILSVRVTLENDDPQRGDARVGARSGLAVGIRYAVDHGAQVISMSLGGGEGVQEGSPEEEDAVRYALGKNVVLIASAGNDGAGANRRNFPAGYPGVIAVGAVDERLRRAPFSNRHDYLSVVAPGTGIVSADGPDSYLIADGTSSAAAFVAGVAALVRSRYPALTALEVRQAIQRGARHPAAGPGYGHGVANALGALQAAEQMHRIPLAAVSRQARSSVAHDRSRELIGIGLLLVVAVLATRVAITR